MTASVANATNRLPVGMGQIMVGCAGDTLEAVLGSCVGIVLCQPRRSLAALAHVVLPSSNARTGLPGKFADTAVIELLRLLELEGAAPSSLVAKLVGGANMFGNATGPLQVGQANITAAKALLAQHRLRIGGEHLGGSQGRHIVVDCQTGLVTVEVVGQAKISL